MEIVRTDTASLADAYKASLTPRPSAVTSDLSTVLALDRTLLSWTRTSLSLISFGFTMYKFLQYVTETRASKNLDPVRGPRFIGMAMIIMGIFFLAAATLQYVGSMRRVTGRRGLQNLRLSFYLSTLLALLGLAALLNMAFRIEP